MVDLRSWIGRRDFVGIVLLTAAHVYWIGLPRIDLNVAFEALVEGGTVNVLILVFCVLVALALGTALGWRQWRTLLSENIPPLQALAGLVAAVCACVATFWAMSLTTRLMAGVGSVGGLPEVIGMLFVVLVALGLLIAAFVVLGLICVAGFYALVYKLRVEEASRFVLPMTIGIGAVVAIIRGIGELVGGGDFAEGYPLAIGVLLAFVGPASVIGLIGLELRDLARSGGISTPREMLATAAS